MLALRLDERRDHAAHAAQDAAAGRQHHVAHAAEVALEVVLHLRQRVVAALALLGAAARRVQLVRGRGELRLARAQVGAGRLQVGAQRGQHLLVLLRRRLALLALALHGLDLLAQHGHLGVALPQLVAQLLLHGAREAGRVVQLVAGARGRVDLVAQPPDLGAAAVGLRAHRVVLRLARRVLRAELPEDLIVVGDLLLGRGDVRVDGPRLVAEAADLLRQRVAAAVALVDPLAGQRDGALRLLQRRVHLELLAVRLVQQALHLLGGLAAGEGLLVHARKVGPQGLHLLRQPLVGLLGSRAVLAQQEEAAHQQLHLQHLQLGRQALVALRLVGLALQAARLPPHLVDDVGQAQQVVLGALQLVQRLFLLGLVLRDAGRLVEDHPALQRPRVDDGVDLALLQHAVAVRPHAGVHAQAGDVLQAALGVVQQVLALAGAEEAARDAHLVEIDRQVALRVVENQVHPCHAGGLQAAGAVEDHVAHARPAHALGALLAQDPADRVEDVRLAAPVGANDDRYPRVEINGRLVGETLEAVQLQPLEEQHPASTSAPVGQAERWKVPYHKKTGGVHE